MSATVDIALCLTCGGDIPIYRKRKRVLFCSAVCCNRQQYRESKPEGLVKNCRGCDLPLEDTRRNWCHEDCRARHRADQLMTAPVRPCAHCGDALPAGVGKAALYCPTTRCRYLAKAARVNPDRRVAAQRQNKYCGCGKKLHPTNKDGTCEGCREGLATVNPGFKPAKGCHNCKWGKANSVCESGYECTLERVMGCRPYGGAILWEVRGNADTGRT